MYVNFGSRVCIMLVRIQIIERKFKVIGSFLVVETWCLICLLCWSTVQCTLQEKIGTGTDFYFVPLTKLFCVDKGEQFCGTGNILLFIMLGWLFLKGLLKGLKSYLKNIKLFEKYQAFFRYR